MNTNGKLFNVPSQGLAMKTYTKLLLITILPSSFLGCMSTSVNDTRLCARDNGEFYTCDDVAPSMSQTVKNTTLFDTKLHFGLLSEYTEQMTADLEKNLTKVDIDKSIVVAPFIYFDSSNQKTSILGNQLAEYFINDLQEIGLPVTDQKLSGKLLVNSDGGFALSRSQQQLNINVGYALTGTMIRNERGIIVNVRLINFITKRVVASTSKLLPNFVINHII